jgi:hypothetical protein
MNTINAMPHDAASRLTFRSSRFPPCQSPLLALEQNTMPWLMKAEPDSRVVKGKDVKVSPV